MLIHVGYLPFIILFLVPLDKQGFFWVFEFLKESSLIIFKSLYIIMFSLSKVMLIVNDPF